MATAQEAIRRLTIQSTTQGVQESTAQLEKLADAQNDVAVASVSTEKATLSLETRFASIERRYNTTVRAQQDYDKVQRQVNAAVAQNPALQDRANAIMAAAEQRLKGVTGAANDNIQTTGLARYELINLSRQAQDVAVSLAGGQSPLTVLFQQGSQIADVFTSSQSTVGGFFKQVGGWLGSFLTVGRVAFGGVAAAIGAATLALTSYLDKQKNVQMSLTGAGRASGATSTSINAAASAGSSITGLSVSEARDLAAALAATGRVANDNILPIVQMGKDIATAFGTDAAGATQILAKAFADPARGAQELNQRLGFLDAATEQNITNLTNQNRLYDAQRVLLAGLKSGLDGVGSSTGVVAKGWTAVTNAISNGWDAIGSAVARATGLVDPLEAQLERAQKRLDALKQTPTINFGFGFTATIPVTADDLQNLQRAQQEVDRLTEAKERNAAASARAQAAQQSFIQSSTVRDLLPEIAQRELLNNQLRIMQDLLSSLANDEAAGARLKQIGMTFEQIAEAAKKASTAANTFKTDYQLAVEQQSRQSQALTAFSPSAKGQAAYDETYAQALRTYNDETKAATLAEGARALAIKGVTVALSEQSRQRLLTANQAVASEQLEIDIIGKNIGQQAEMRANLASRQQLEQQASQNRTAFDDAEYARLQKVNAEYGKRVQLATQAQVRNDISFGQQTSLLNPDDVQIAQQLRQLYPDVATALSSVEAAGLRTNQALSGLSSSVSGPLVTGLADVFDHTKSVGQGFTDMKNVVIRAIEEMIIKITIVTPLMRALQAAANSFGGILGFGGGSSAAAATTGLDGLAAIHHTGYGPGDAITSTRSVNPAVFTRAPRFHTGIGPGERAAVIKNDESVLTAGQMRALGGSINSSPVTNVYIEGAPSQPTVTKKKNDTGGVDIMVSFRNMVRDVMTDDANNGGPITEAMGRRFRNNSFGTA